MMLEFEKLEQKRAELDRYQPLPLDLQKRLDEWYCIELTYTSNAIEGNSLSRQETALVLEKGLTPSTKPLVDYIEAKNHAEAFWLILNHIEKKQTHLSETTVLELHQALLKGIDDPNAGNYRKVPVRVMGSGALFPNPLKVPSLMAEFFEWLQSDYQQTSAEWAALAHYKLVTIHPFIDGNGRTAY